MQMLGVASEGAFFEMAESFAAWIVKKQAGNKFPPTLADPKTSFFRKFECFRAAMDPFKDDLDHDLKEDLTVDLDGVLNLTRRHRNDAGHPTGKSVSRDKALHLYRMFPTYLKKLYGLRSWFAR